jgi:hypothetical protein
MLFMITKISHYTYILDMNAMYMYYSGKPFFSNTRQNGEWTETITRQDEKELAMFLPTYMINKTDRSRIRKQITIWKRSSYF